MKTKCLVSCLLLFVIVATKAQDISTDSLSKHVYTLSDDALEGRSPGTRGGRAAANYIADQFKGAGIDPLLSDYFHDFSFRVNMVAEAKNVVGIIEGSHPELKKEYIVVGAHYDHLGYYIDDETKEKIVFNGADDNASGVAAVIELGRKIAKNRTEFDRSIVFVAFDGEETGLNGSKWLLFDSVIQPSQVKGMISVDMIGMLSKREGIELLGIGTLKGGEVLAQQIATKHSISLKKTTKKLQDRTDTKPFGDLGIPSVHITTGTVSPYHKPEDDAHLLDYEGMANISEYIYELLYTMATAEEHELASTLVNKKGKMGKKLIRPGLRLNVGSSWHKYPDEFFKGKNAFAVQSGLYAHIELSKRFKLQPEILYETIGSNHANGQFRTHSINTPLNVLISFAGNRENEVWSYFVLGGYYTYNFSGKEGSSTIDFDALYNAQEYGCNVGFAINVSQVQIAFTRKIGLSNLYQDKASGNILNNAMFATFGWLF